MKAEAQSDPVTEPVRLALQGGASSDPARPIREADGTLHDLRSGLHVSFRTPASRRELLLAALPLPEGLLG